MRFHAIGGLPRSGSTLLCNILAQNPQFHVSSTSPLPGLVAGLVAGWSNSPEVRGMLVRDREGTLARLRLTARGVCESWYDHRPVSQPVVFDKSRAWNYHAGILQAAWGSMAKLITISRDLRSIYASIERRHMATAILDDAAHLSDKVMFNRASRMFGTEGPIGAALLGLEDLIRRRPANWYHVRYEDLCAQPQREITKLYEAIQEASFEHDFGAIVNQATDVDELYLLKFDHVGAGPLKPPTTRDWHPFTPPDIEEHIMRKFGMYNAAFGYV